MRLIRKTPPMQDRSSTTQHRLILEVIQEAQGPIDGKEVYRRASARDQSIIWATVHRSLNLFKKLIVQNGTAGRKCIEFCSLRGKNKNNQDYG